MNNFIRVLCSVIVLVGLAGCGKSPQSVQMSPQLDSSKSHAIQIAMACKLYALDNGGKFPPSLQALVPKYLPTAGFLASPLKPEVPEGYSITPGLTDKSASDLVLIEDKFAPSVAHARIVAHVDAQGEVIPVR